MSARPFCNRTKRSGKQCKAYAQPGRDVCRWHDESPEAKAKHRAEARRGGLTKAYGALVAGSPLTDDPALAAIDPGTADGLRQCVARAIRALCGLPFDVRVANSLGTLATAQRALIESSDFERRLAELEATHAQSNPSPSPSHLRAV